MNAIENGIKHIIPLINKLKNADWIFNLKTNTINILINSIKKENDISFINVFNLNSKAFLIKK